MRIDGYRVNAPAIFKLNDTGSPELGAGIFTLEEYATRYLVKSSF